MFKKLIFAAAMSLSLVPAFGGTANAHASIQMYGSNATAGGYGVMFVRIPHGCTGGLATDTVVVSIPAGFTSVKPQQIGGWQASRTMAGTTVTEVRWSGGSLPDSQFADFGISVRFPTTAGMYGFKVVQYCGTATATWDGEDLPMMKVASVDAPTPAVVKASKHHSAMKVMVDASTVNGGDKVVLELASEGKTVRVLSRMLNSQGDLVVEVPLRGKTAKGSTYVLRDGSTVTVKLSGHTIGTATMGAGSSSGH